ncbi:MAG TPA: VCBS repeat-containing protein [Chryseolinea sp.]|nr:VCBS repeat-containing protein [Chryseolinea sp.]
MTKTSIRTLPLTILPILLLLLGCGKSDKPAQTEAAPATTTTPAVFKKVPSSESGVAFANKVDENINTFFDVFAYVYNGGGVAIGDINNDGLPDIYFTGNEVPNKLYLNQGNLKFKDITEAAGVQGNGKWNNGVTMVDINADGLLDIYVCKGGWQETAEQRRNLLFVNQGDLTFKEQAKAVGLDEPGYSIHASFFDMDNDNDLDAYITNRPDSFDLPLTQMVRQKKLSPSISRDKLMINEKGKFKEIGLKAGITNNFGYALSVVTSDLNNDGYTDIFVANDFAEGDYMYINQKNGTFKEKIKEATNHISMYSMGTDVADINNDGLEDIMVSEMLPEDYRRSKVSMPSMDVEGFYAIVNSGMHKQYMHNALHLNQGNLFFSEISQLSGVAKTDWSWSCLMSDFDNDGNRDMFVANGYKRDVFDGDAQEKLGEYVRLNKHKFQSAEEMMEKGFKDFINIYSSIKVKNYLFKNKGDLQFENVSDVWGFNESSFSNGAAVGDLDNDGDLDLVINNLDDQAFVYENTSSPANNYLKVKLAGPPANADGIGAKVTIYTGDQIQYFENKTVRGYLSSNEPIVHFGLGKIEKVDSVLVVWNDGKESLVKIVDKNQTLKVAYAQAVKQTKRAQKQNPLFAENAKTLLAQPFNHKENEFNEYKVQTLLPHMFSKSGPFVSTGDINKDGNDDFFVGGAAGQAGSLYVQQNGAFVKAGGATFESDKNFEDMGSTLFDADQDGDLDLYVVSGGSEYKEGSEQYNDRLYTNDGKGNFKKTAAINTLSSGSCVVAHDIDGDGDLDLFRGGQVVSGTYPKTPKSYILINEKGKFEDKTTSISSDISQIGMVSSATWTDLDGDKSAELIVVGEWMPVRIFQYKNGRLEDVSKAYGVENTEGWWNTVVADDLDGDGDQDLIAGNIGENYKFKASYEKPFQVFAKDFDSNGSNDIFLARFVRDSVLVPIRGKECTSAQMPIIKEKFPTYLSFATSDLPTILGKDIETAEHRKAYLFSSVILLNNNGNLSIKKLPIDAQLSAVMGIVVDDFDGDGKKDILIGGNKFDTEVETTPADASPGVFLKGAGDMTFKSIKSEASGFFIPYNVKDIHSIMIKGEKAILVGANNEKLRIFTLRNKNAAGTKLALNK